MKQVVATLALLRRGDMLLLAMKKRGFGEGYWNGPGGKVEPGESLKQGLVRECQEELGITLTSFHKVAEHDFVMDIDTEPWHIYGHVYLCEQWEGEPQESDEMAPKWFHKDDIPYEQMWADDIYWVPMVLAGKRIRTTFSFKSDNTLLSQDIEEVEQFDE